MVQFRAAWEHAPDGPCFSPYARRSKPPSLKAPAVQSGENLPAAQDAPALPQARSIKPNQGQSNLIKVKKLFVNLPGAEFPRVDIEAENTTL
jgi:hypothetical protein